MHESNNRTAEAVNWVKFQYQAGLAFSATPVFEHRCDFVNLNRRSSGLEFEISPVPQSA